MRILHFLSHLSGGGAERQFSYLAPELVRMGHDVHVAYSTAGPSRPELPGVVLHQLKSLSNYDPYLLWQVLRLIRRIKPDIIHTWLLQMDVFGGIAVKLNRVPWILSEHTHPLTYIALPWKQSLKHRLRVWAGSGASAIVSVSRGGDEYWKTQRPNSRRFVNPLGLSVHEVDRAVAALPPGLPLPEAPIVLYAGRMVAYKNVKAFLEALACVKLKQEVSGVLCGDGPQRSELELLKHKLGLDTDAHFTGHLSAALVWGLMKKASVFVSLSVDEGGAPPYTVLEAMACGCPLVLSDCPAHREILDERCALFVDPADIQQTADIILQALHNADASKARALIAKQKTQERSISKMAQDFERVYAEVITTRKPR